MIDIQVVQQFIQHHILCVSPQSYHLLQFKFNFFPFIYFSLLVVYFVVQMIVQVSFLIHLSSPPIVQLTEPKMASLA